jgi:hypothetical protein
VLYNEWDRTDVNPEQKEHSPVISQQHRFALAPAIAVLAFATACSHATSNKSMVDSSLRGAGAIERQIEGGTASNAPKLDHVIPARDSQGSQPTRFEWTSVPQADSYSIGIWNEVDMLIWRKDGIPNNYFVPTDLRLEPGTYFWTISALRQGEEITASGLSAFVVRPATP